MNLHNLLKITTRSKKRVGRGIGSGRGKTAGRGTKGQKARGKVPLGFIGGTLPLYKKLPFKRGFKRGRGYSPKIKPLPVNLSKLSGLEKNTTVDIQALIDKNIVKAANVKKRGVKIVAGGEIKVSLTIKLPISASAAKQIEKAGGKVANV